MRLEVPSDMYEAWSVSVHRQVPYAVLTGESGGTRLAQVSRRRPPKWDGVESTQGWAQPSCRQLRGIA